MAYDLKGSSTTSLHEGYNPFGSSPLLADGANNRGQEEGLINASSVIPNSGALVTAPLSEDLRLYTQAEFEAAKKKWTNKQLVLVVVPTFMLLTIAAAAVTDETRDAASFSEGLSTVWNLCWSNIWSAGSVAAKYYVPTAIGAGSYVLYKVGGCCRNSFCKSDSKQDAALLPKPRL